MPFIIYACTLIFGASLSINASDELSSHNSHCFKKASAGERLIAYDVTRIVERSSLDGCQEECNIYKCTYFGFGLIALGNGTCELTTDREISRRQDSDFDLYQRTEECAEGKPKGYEEACYKRLVTGKRLHERFIRHSLPCNSLEACQHQCSIEKHFECQGFNIRLDPARVGRGVCELSSIAAVYLNPNADFVYDPEFTYYEKDRENDSPNCGRVNQIPNAHPGDSTIGYHPADIGGPYYGGDSYGPWSTGHGTVDHGPWGSHGYGSGFYESNNPSRGPAPSLRPNTPFSPDPYGYAGDRPYPDYVFNGPVYPGGHIPLPSYPGGSSRPPYTGGGSPQGSQHFGGAQYPNQGTSIGPYYPIGGDSSRPPYSGGAVGSPYGGGLGVSQYPGRPRPTGAQYPEAKPLYPGGSGGSSPYPTGGSQSPEGSGGDAGGGPFGSGNLDGSSRHPLYPGGPQYPAGTGGILPRPPFPEDSVRPQYPSGEERGKNTGGPQFFQGRKDSREPQYPIIGGEYGPPYSGSVNPQYPRRGSPGSQYLSGGSQYPSGSGGGALKPSYPGDFLRPQYPPNGGALYPGRPGGESLVPSYPQGDSGRSYHSESNQYSGGSERGLPRPSYAEDSLRPDGGVERGNPQYQSGGPQHSPGGKGGPTTSQYPEDNQSVPPTFKYPFGTRRYDRPNRIPTYIIIDADAQGGSSRDLQPYRPGSGYLPSKQSGPYSPRPPRPLPLPQIPSRLPPPSHRPQNYIPSLDGSFGIVHNTISQEVCYRREHPGYKLNPSSIKGMYETPTVLDCEAMCNKSPFKCTGYSFRYSSAKSGPNCLLTDFASLNKDTHLLPDRSCDVYFKMATCVDNDRISSDTECFIKVATNRKLDSTKVVHMVSVSGMSDCELACLDAKFFTCRSFSFRHGPGVIGEPFENCYLSDWPISALTHLDFIPQASHEVYERGSYGHGCEFEVGSPHIGPKPPLASYPNVPLINHSKEPWGVRETWRHFTVNGWPCRIGTECQLNSEAGFWSCEVEGGDRAQWDYCCKPKHSCGFSKGYRYPWCHVGEAGPEQWRPCSEFYFPDFGNRFPYRPDHDQTPPPVHTQGFPRPKRPWSFGEEEFGPPSFWPISYLYAEPPPNETYFWEPEEFHEHYYHYPDHYIEESPRIRFKPCGRKTPFPRAIIQKLDLKNKPKAGNPEDQLRMEEKPRNPKKSELVPKTPTPKPEITLGFSPANQYKENIRNEVDDFPFVGNVTSGKRQLHPEENKTDSYGNKTKEVIKTVEKIIETSTSLQSLSDTEIEKNETLSKVETKHSAFLTLSQLEKTNFRTSFWD